MIKKSSASSALLLLLASVIWGSAFLAQDKGADHIGSFAFTGIRFLMGAVAVFIVIIITDLAKKKAGSYKPMTQSELRSLLISGIICGCILTLAAFLQQAALGGIAGIQPTTPGKAGFITALYILFVPIISLFFKKKTPSSFWCCIAVAIVGFYFLCVAGSSFSLSGGDFLTLLSSVAYSFHIVAIDRLAKKCDSFKFSLVQFLTVAAICSIFTFTLEMPSPKSLVNALPSLIYVGLFSSGIAFTIQVVAQKDLHPAMATMIMSLEAVFALLTGIIFDHANNIPNFYEAIGSVLIFGSVLAAQLLPSSKAQKNNTDGEKNETR